MVDGLIGFCYNRSMKKYLFWFVALPLLGGCVFSSPKAPKTWNIEWGKTGVERIEREKLPAVKLMLVDVRAPYNGARLAVLRSDGSIAFDSYNSFAAQPAAILRGAAMDVMESSTAFEAVVSGSSSASAPLAAEIMVSRLALDCQTEGHRDASVLLTIVLVGNRTVLSSASAEASEPVEDGNYSAAFSRAFSRALLTAIGYIDLK